MRRMLVLGLLLSSFTVAACGTEDAPNVDGKTTTRGIGVEGGQLELTHGGKVVIPAGALNQTQTVRISELDLAELAPLPDNLEAAGKPYAFEPFTLAIAEPVKISLPFTDSATEVRPIKLNDKADPSWTTVFPSSTTSDMKLELDTTSFGIYLAARPKRSSGVITLPDGAIATPDAATSDATSTDAMTAADAGSDATFDSGSDASNDARNDAAIEDGSVGPAINQEAYVKPSNTRSGLYLGWSVAISGDTMVVGGTGDSSASTGVNGSQADESYGSAGAAYVFVRSGGVWTQQAYLKASNTGSGDSFGESVAISGDTIVVGAPREGSNATGVDGDGSNNAALTSGAAYVFVRNGGVWTHQAYLKASNTGGSDQFGARVAISGETIVVGAREEDSNATTINGDGSNNLAMRAGAAYVFVRTTDTWTQQAYLKASNAAAGDAFGTDVAISNDTILISATYEGSDATGVNGDQANNNAESSGAAYVFVRSGVTWTQQAYLKASNTEAYDSFGWQVALDNDTAVVSTIFEGSDATGVNGDQANNGAAQSGAAYVFVRNGIDWTQQAYLKASNTEAFDQFGGALGLSGDTIVIAAKGEASDATGIDGDQTNNDGAQTGAAYELIRNGTTWTQRSYIKSSNGATTFGWSVALSNGTIVIGAPDEASNATGVNGNQTDTSAASSGAVYIFH